MSNQQNDDQTVVWAVLIPVVILAICLAVGLGVSKTFKNISSAKAQASAAPAAWVLSANESAVRV
jgi:uncharacterized protein YpmB